jgi:hypothetical protein
MTSIHKALMTAAALALAGCADTGADETASDERSGESPPATLADPKGDRSEPVAAYDTPDGEALPASADATLRAALDVLGRVAVEGTSGRQRTLAAETLARIAAGDVLLGSLETARGEDLWHMCLDTAAVDRCGDRPPGDPAWAGDSALRAALPQALDGYQWGNRLYFAFGTPEAEGLEPDALAVTLVHETNHALNRSECSYYSDILAHEEDETLAYLEEYRAFVAECVHRRGANATATRCDAWANDRLETLGYGFEPDLSRLLLPGETQTRVIAASLFADDGRFGWLAPLPTRWPEHFEACETDGR